MTTTNDITSAIERAKSEIREDIANGVFDAEDITTFADLHDYVDANEYGGLCDDVDNIFWNADGTPNEENSNALQDAVDAWIKEGGLR